MAITALPTAPQRSDTPADFITKADAFVAALPNLVTEVNAATLALNLNSTSDTSATSNSIATGAKTFTVSAGKSFLGGMFLMIADTAAPSTNFMFGQVTSYSGTSLVMNITAIGGSGTKTAWTISQSAAGVLGGAVVAGLGANTFTGLQKFATGANIASAATINLSTATGNTVHVTGTTPVSAVTLTSGQWMEVIYDAACPLTYHATNHKLNTGGKSVVLDAGDSVFYFYDGTTVSGWISKLNGKGISSLPTGHIYGLQCSSAADSTHDITTGTGSCRDASDVVDINLLASITKQIDAAWAVGNNLGGMFTGAVAANTTYYFFIIRRSDTGVVDAGWDTSITAANKPANYDSYRLIMSVKTDASALLRPFEQNGTGLERDIRYITPVLDINNVAQSTSYLSTTLSTPAGKRTKAFGNIVRAGTVAGIIQIISTNYADAAPSLTASPLAATGINSAVTPSATQWACWTDTSSRISTATNAGTPSIYLTTEGYKEYL